MALLSDPSLFHVFEEFTSPCALPPPSRALMPLFPFVFPPFTLLFCSPTIILLLLPPPTQLRLSQGALQHYCARRSCLPILIILLLLLSPLSTSPPHLPPFPIMLLHFFVQSFLLPLD